MIAADTGVVGNLRLCPASNRRCAAWTSFLRGDGCRTCTWGFVHVKTIEQLDNVLALVSRPGRRPCRSQRTVRRFAGYRPGAALRARDAARPPRSGAAGHAVRRLHSVHGRGQCAGGDAEARGPPRSRCFAELAHDERNILFDTFRVWLENDGSLRTAGEIALLSSQHRPLSTTSNRTTNRPLPVATAGRRRDLAGVRGSSTSHVAGVNTNIRTAKRAAGIPTKLIDPEGGDVVGLRPAQSNRTIQVLVAPACWPSSAAAPRPTFRTRNAEAICPMP